MHLCRRAKQLWDLVHDDDEIARERETAAKNRNKYSGYDRDTAAFAGRAGFSSPTTSCASPSAGFATVPKVKPAPASGGSGAASGGAETAAADATAAAAAVDPVAATEARISKLMVAEDGAVEGPVPRARMKPKLSEISVRSQPPPLPHRGPTCASAVSFPNVAPRSHL